MSPYKYSIQNNVWHIVSTIETFTIIIILYKFGLLPASPFWNENFGGRDVFLFCTALSLANHRAWLYKANTQ